MFGSSFNGQKLKPQLKMAVGRIEILKNKKSALLKQSMRQVAMLLAEEPPKEEKARIRGEALIRDDNLIEALEIIQLECELLHERIKLLEYAKDCPPDLVSVVSTLIWAAHRVDVPELLLIKKQFKAKYGQKFVDNAFNNTNGCLNERVVTKLSVHPPAAYLVQVYLEKICEQYEVDWKPLLQISTDGFIEPIQAPTGISVPIGAGTGLGPKLVPYQNNNNQSDVPVVNGIPYNHPNNTGSSSPAFSDLTKIPTNNINNNNYNNSNNDFPTAPSFGGNSNNSSSRGGAFGGSGGGGTISTTNTNTNTTRSSQHSDVVVVEPEFIIPPEQDDSERSSRHNNNINNNTNNTTPFIVPKVGGTVIGGPEQPPKNTGTGTSSNSSYADLAARFNQLRK